jgi:hypothetical protein
MTTAEAYGLAGNIVSIVLGVVAILMAVAFYLAGRGTEQRVAASLTKIETQTDMLQKITKTQLDRLTRFATERPAQDPARPIDLVMQLIEVAQPLIMLIRQQPAVGAPQAEQLRPFLVNCHIVLYYYTALTNFWAQAMLPNLEDFDETNNFHALTKRSVDGSETDFTMVANILKDYAPDVLQASPFAHLLNEAQTVWRTTVQDSAGAWVRRQHAAPLN